MELPGFRSANGFRRLSPDARSATRIRLNLCGFADRITALMDNPIE